ncbi:hypothetical protein C5167_012851 [Papaver somniferum]|uniref:ubiquitinyl hydrolase 1 n=1 Tax=Papaver somniferum TaxID=3469 RepID=A0A4Y7IYM9_PAPSO|nr:hypothetical protein C5167_012851 [Papaver somniferum]
MNASKDGERESEQKEITGFYELISVLVHMGESGDYGHYVAYVKQEDGTWTEFNDKITTEQWEEGSVTEFNGGDNTAYVCMYKARLS